MSNKELSSCILFFSGWGMDPVPFRPLPSARHDLLMLYDYRELDPAGIGALIPTGYQRLYLLAWSMGVWAAGHLLGPFRERFTALVAVNGTITPIDDRCGIEPKAYADMINSFSAETLDAFYRSMFAVRRESGMFFRNRPRRPADTILNELVMLRRSYLEYGPAQNLFTRKIVGSRDRIFPARSQLRAWGRDNCTVLPLPHFPFYAMPGWHAFFIDT